MGAVGSGDSLPVSSVLEADCVAKSYGARRVLTSGSLRAVAGEVRVLLGRNGAGKSTLMKIAAGCVQPDSGSVRESVPRLVDIQAVPA